MDEVQIKELFKERLTFKAQVKEELLKVSNPLFHFKMSQNGKTGQ